MPKKEKIKLLNKKNKVLYIFFIITLLLLNSCNSCNYTISELENLVMIADGKVFLNKFSKRNCLNAIEINKKLINKVKQTGIEEYNYIPSSYIAIGKIFTILYKNTKNKKYYEEALKNFNFVLTNYKPKNISQKKRDYIPDALLKLAYLYAVDNNFDSSYSILKNLKIANKERIGLTFLINNYIEEVKNLENKSKLK